METYCSMHRMHCSSSCLLKLHVENDEIRRITSAGDICLRDCEEADEKLFPPQKRACVKGYAEIDHLNSPYRMREPLLQTASRGTKSGFKAISWDEAIDRTAAFYEDMLKEKERLGYLPIWEKAGVGTFLGKTIMTYGSSSCGNADAAMFAALGGKKYIQGHHPVDMFNTSYLVVWSNNPVEVESYLSFWFVKLKEKGIPITIVDSRYSETVGAVSNAQGDIPGFICPRPGTDGALMAAMCYVIYKRDLYDRDFIRDYCFGFYKNDEVTSRSCGKDPVTGEAFFGKTYRVPEGESFVEYLEGMAEEYGGYEGVLKWAEQETGVKSELIERFALAYANAKPAFIFSRYNGGAQRSYNGCYYSWMLIALSAMTGNLNKKGGGFGEIRGEDEHKYPSPKMPNPFTEPKHDQILITEFQTDRLIRTGLDGRTPKQLRDDVLHMNGLDLGEDARLEVQGIVKGGKNSNWFNQLPGINLRKQTWEKVKFVLSYEREMSTMAMMSDIILPSTGQYETPTELMQHNWGGSDLFVKRCVAKAPGLAKTDMEIHRLIGRKLGLTLTPMEEFEDLARKQWQKAEVPGYIRQHYPEYQKPSYEELLEMGVAQLPTGPEDSKPDEWKYAAGEYPSETGRINFYSPYTAKRARSPHGIYRACYVPMEDRKENRYTGGEYELKLITPHTIMKADATFDNVPTLRSIRPNTVNLNPEDAKRRSLQEGQMAWIYRDEGCIRLPVHITISVPEGVVTIPHGPWYEPDETDRFTAYLDMDGNGEKLAIDTAVDKGGNTNTLLPEECGGMLDPFYTSVGLNSNAYFVEVSDHNPCSEKRKEVQ